MPEARFLLLGPRGKSALATLRDDIAVAGLRHEIATALGLPRWRALMVRNADGRPLDKFKSLATSEVRPGDVVVVEPVSGWQLLHRLVLRRSPAGMPASAYQVLPCYLVIDTSSSMSGQPIDTINSELLALQTAMRTQPKLVESCHLSLITFDEAAKVHIGLTDVSKMIFTPLRADVTLTLYSKAFKLLRATIASDLYELYRSGRRPYRPVVFFLSDGCSAPGDVWLGALDDLVSQERFYGAPHILAFGFGDADKQQIEEVGRTRAYMPTAGGPSANLSEFMEFMLNSITNSITHAGQDQYDVLEIPKRKDWEWVQVR